MTTEEPWTVRRILDSTIGFLKQKGCDSPRLDAEVLLAHSRNCQRIQLYTQYDELVTDEQRNTMRELVRRRAGAEPVGYLVGYREFFSLNFKVNRHVLIPRPDTEILVMTALDVLKGVQHPRVLELCTGSGCIPVAIAKNCASARIVAVEISEEACDVARSNIATHDLEQRIQVRQGDLFDPIADMAKFDLIVSNPPYIAAGEMESLDADVRDHEPHLALVSGTDGFNAIRRIVAESKAFLNPGGWLMFELSPEQADATTELLSEHSYSAITIRKDLSGQARVAMGQMEG